MDEWPTDQPWHTETHLNHPVRRERNYSGNVGDLSPDFVHRPEPLGIFAQGVNDGRVRFHRLRIDELETRGPVAIRVLDEHRLVFDDGDLVFAGLCFVITLVGHHITSVFGILAGEIASKHTQIPLQ